MLDLETDNRGVGLINLKYSFFGQNLISSHLRNYVEKYSAIKHPNIPKLYFYEQNGFLNVVYENCPSVI